MAVIGSRPPEAKQIKNPRWYLPQCAIIELNKPWEQAMDYRELGETEINAHLLDGFERQQEVVKCWRKPGGTWIIADDSFIDQWSMEERKELIMALKDTVHAGGVVFAAVAGDGLKGFASVEPNPFGSECSYLDLSNLHVSKELRGLGIGRQLFLLCVSWARRRGADKLYISAHSAVETQAFYRAMGCVEAAEYSARHVKKEPYDCQLEYIL